MVNLTEINIDDISDDMLLEFANWTTMTDIKALSEYITDEIVSYIHFYAIGSIFSFTNDWNKTQYAMKICEWKIYPTKDTFPVLSEFETLLAGGKRLLRELIKIVKNSWEHVKIVRIGEKFDTRYYASEWNPKKDNQTKIVAKEGTPTIPKKTTKSKKK